MKKDKIVAIQADPIEKINPKTDTSLLLALEAQKRKYKIYWFEAKDVSFIGSKLYAKIKKIKLFKDRIKFYEIKSQIKFDISKAKFLLIRQNPPFDIDYFNSTLSLDYIKQKTKIINNPESIRNISEKLFSINLTKFGLARIALPQVTISKSPSLISFSASAIVREAPPISK